MSIENNDAVCWVLLAVCLLCFITIVFITFIFSHHLLHAKPRALREKKRNVPHVDVGGIIEMDSFSIILTNYVCARRWVRMYFIYLDATMGKKANPDS